MAFLLPIAAEGIALITETIGLATESVGVGVEASSGAFLGDSAGAFLGTTARNATGGFIVGTVVNQADGLTGASEKFQEVKQTANSLLMGGNNPLFQAREVRKKEIIKKPTLHSHEDVEHQIHPVEKHKSPEQIETFINEELDGKPSLTKVFNYTFGTQVVSDKMDELKAIVTENATKMREVVNTSIQTGNDIPTTLSQYSAFNSVGNLFLGYNVTLPTNDPVFNQIQSKFTGSGTGPDLFNYSDSEKAFKITEPETGITYTWKLEWTPKNPVKPIFGVWTGINSMNNDYPSCWLPINYPVGPINRVYRELDGKKQIFSRLDFYCCLHDLGYSSNVFIDGANGFFASLIADYKLISRISASLKRNEFLPVEKESAIWALNYFTRIAINHISYAKDENKKSLAEHVVDESHSEQLTQEERESLISLFNSVFHSHEKSNILASTQDSQDEIYLKSRIEALEIFL